MLTMLGLTRKLANGLMTSIWRGYSEEASITFKGTILRRAQVPETEYEDEEALEQATEMEAKRTKQPQPAKAASDAIEKVQVQAINLPPYMETKCMLPVTAVEGARLEGNAQREKLNGLDDHLYSY